MEWTPGGVSGDIEDRRSQGGGGGGFGFGGGGFGGMHLGIGGVLVLLVLSFIFKVNLLTLFSGGAPVPARPAYSGDADRTVDSDREVQFVSFVLDDVQNTWTRVLQPTVTPYRHTKLVLFRDYTQSGCGLAQSATGPFYCPQDEKVYIDLGFFDELTSRFGAPGEFAQAYVLAHEIGHHVQKLLGIEQQVRRLQQEDPSQADPLSVKLELQADCLAGVWAIPPRNGSWWTKPISMPGWRLRRQWETTDCSAWRPAMSARKPSLTALRRKDKRRSAAGSTRANCRRAWRRGSRGCS